MAKTKESQKSTRKIQRHRQITIPKEMFEKLGLAKGDFVELIKKDNRLVVVPQKLVDKDQSWFWSEKWQEKERKAEKDIEQGRTSGTYTSTEEMKKDFEKRQR